jgi:hypothetical protein
MTTSSNSSALRSANGRAQRSRSFSPATPRSLALRSICVAMTLLLLGGCVSGRVQRGAVIGAASGLVLGGTTGVLISDKHLLGSDDSAASGNISLAKGPTIAASILIGTVVGAIVGAMVGHRRDEGYDPEKLQASSPKPAATPDADPKPAAKPDAGAKEQARAPWLRGL